MLDYIILDGGNIICPPNWISDGNTINYHKIYYCIAGSAIYQDSFKTRRLIPQTLYIFPQNQPYQIIHSEEHFFHVLWFHADCRLPIVSDFYEHPISQSGTLFHLLNSLDQALIDAPKIIGNLLPVFIKALDIPDSTISAHQKVLLLCTDYIHTHISEPVTNEMLAHISGYHKHYLIQIFKQHMGITPRQYVIHTKFNYAKKLLLQGNSIYECAHLIGYKNESDFGRDFKTLFSVSPGQYKKQTSLP